MLKYLDIHRYIVMNIFIMHTNCITYFQFSACMPILPSWCKWRSTCQVTHTYTCTWWVSVRNCLFPNVLWGGWDDGSICKVTEELVFHTHVDWTWTQISSTCTKKDRCGVGRVEADRSSELADRPFQQNWRAPGSLTDIISKSKVESNQWGQPVSATGLPSTGTPLHNHWHAHTWSHIHVSPICTQIKLQKKIYNFESLSTKPQSVARIWIQKFYYTFRNL